jgi:release factor glutamine methyltransferase
MTIKESLLWSIKLLKDREVEGPKASAEFLLRQILGVSKTYLISYPNRKLNFVQEAKFRRWVGKRANHQPVWYITGKIEFYGQDFFVNKNVLIPRPETEIILEKVIKKSFGIRNKSILDVGTGSGAIVLTLAKKLPGNKYFASDLSPEALKVARKNAKNLKLQVEFKEGDLFGPWVGQKFDLVLANLPYVPHEDMNTLAYDLIHYEPRLALDGGVEGLEVYKRFFEELPDFLNKKAKVYCEIGDKQGQAVLVMAKRAFPEAKIELMADYAEHDRIVIIEL